MKTYVINKDTIKSKLAVGAMYLGTAFLLVKGCDYTVDRRAENRLDDNKDEVVELVEEKQFDDARKLMRDYNYVDELRSNDFISLNNLIDREERKYDELDGTFKAFDEGIKNRKLDEAWTAFKSLNEMEALNKSDEDSLKKVLYKISDQYLLNKYAKGDPKEKLEYGEEYLQFYPSGTEAFGIANYVIGKRADVLLNNIVFGEKPSRVLEDYEHLNDVLKIKIDGVNVKNFISTKGLDSLTNKYIDEKTYVKLASELQNGDWAVVISDDNKWDNNGYLNDRRKQVELGKRGKVIDFTKAYISSDDSVKASDADYMLLRNIIFLEFSNIEEIEWNEKWNVIIPYMNRGLGYNYTEGVAAFLDTEVKGIPRMSSAQVELMKKELATAKDLIESYVPKEIVVSDSLSIPSDSLIVPSDVKVEKTTKKK